MGMSQSTFNFAYQAGSADDPGAGGDAEQAAELVHGHDGHLTLPSFTLTILLHREEGRWKGESYEEEEEYVTRSRPCNTLSAFA